MDVESTRLIGRASAWLLEPASAIPELRNTAVATISPESKTAIGAKNNSNERRQIMKNSTRLLPLLILLTMANLTFAQKSKSPSKDINLFAGSVKGESLPKGWSSGD